MKNRGVGCRGSTLVLRHGLDEEALREALRQAQCDTDVGHRALAFSLNDLREREAHQLWGYATPIHFACAELAPSRRLARARPDIEFDDVREVLAELGLDQRGLDPRQRRALAILRRRGRRPLGAARLASALDVSPRAWRGQLEPGLLQMGLVSCTPRRLVATGPGGLADQGADREQG